jgi:hypothetical protein
MASAALNQPKAFINCKDYAVTWNAAVENGTRPGQRQDHPRVRGLRDQDCLTVATQSVISAH